MGEIRPGAFVVNDQYAEPPHPVCVETADDVALHVLDRLKEHWSRYESRLTEDADWHLAASVGMCDTDWPSMKECSPASVRAFVKAYIGAVAQRTAECIPRISTMLSAAVWAQLRRLCTSDLHDGDPAVVVALLCRVGFNVSPAAARSAIVGVTPKWRKCADVTSLRVALATFVMKAERVATYDNLSAQIVGATRALLGQLPRELEGHVSSLLHQLHGRVVQVRAHTGVISAPFHFNRLDFGVVAAILRRIADGMVGEPRILQDAVPQWQVSCAVRTRCALAPTGLQFKDL